jgi:hypothetical protein
MNGSLYDRPYSRTVRLPGVAVKQVLAGTIDPAALWTGEQDADCHPKNIPPKTDQFLGVGTNSLTTSPHAGCFTQAADLFARPR